MKQTQQFMIALAIALISIFNAASDAVAQVSPSELVDTGTVISDIEFKDIHGNEFSLYSVLDEGYTVAIELGLTTCPICWSFSESGIFDRLYKDYGPEGQVAPKKVFPMLIECNPNTTDADLRGTGNNTRGDWVTGHDYAIIDLNEGNYRPTLENFFKSSSGGFLFTTPAFLIICPDRKVIYTGTGNGSMSESMILKSMAGRCAAAVGIGEVEPAIDGFSMHLYPNPVLDFLNLQLNASRSTRATLTVTDLLGRVIQQEDLMLKGREELNLSVETESLKPGVYFVSILTNQGTFVRQFVKK